MSTQNKPTPEELFDALEEEEMADEAERILALSDDALDDELAAEGFDPKALRARGAAWAAECMEAERSGAAPAKLASVTKLPSPSLPRTRARVLPWLAAAAIAAAIGAIIEVKGGAIVAMFGPRHEPIGPDIPDASFLPPEPSPNELAAKLRHDAFQACAEDFWALCEERTLDEAKKNRPRRRERLKESASRAATDRPGARARRASGRQAETAVEEVSAARSGTPVSRPRREVLPRQGLTWPGHPLPLDRPAGFGALAAGLAFAFPWLHTSGDRPHMEPTDVTIEVLKGIRDELRGTNARLDRVERRQGETEVRLATQLVAVVSAVHEVRDLLREDRQLRDRVADHERRLTAVETRVGG